MTERNVDIMQAVVGKTIESVRATKDTLWLEEDDFIIRFTDGTEVEVTADMGQGVGYVITEVSGGGDG